MSPPIKKSFLRHYFVLLHYFTLWSEMEGHCNICLKNPFYFLHPPSSLLHFLLPLFALLSSLFHTSLSPLSHSSIFPYQVVKLDLQHNELQTVPSCLLELPSLSELNLNHNKLVEIPNIPEWSPSLTVLELSHNQLTTMPPNTIATAIRSLNLSYNMLCMIPLCICSFTTLHALDLSHNPDIRALPAEMGRLTNLTSLQLEGLKDLSDPPRNMQKDAQECVRYFNSKLRGTKSLLMNPVQDNPETVQETPNIQAKNPVQIVKPQTYMAGISQETLDVKLPSNDLVRISCPKPAKLGHVLSELQVNSGLDEDQCKIKYYKGDSSECIQIQTQEHLDQYLQMENRPQLYLSRST